MHLAASSAAGWTSTRSCCGWTSRSASCCCCGRRCGRCGCSANGGPNWKIVWIFALGTVLMRSAGVAVNDFADRNFDPHVARTREPAAGRRAVSPKEALILAAVLALLAFVLILPLGNRDPAVVLRAVPGRHAIRSPSASSPCRRPIWASPSASASRWPTPPRLRQRARHRLDAAARQHLLDHRLRHRVRDGRPRGRPQDRHPDLGDPVRPLRRGGGHGCATPCFWRSWLDRLVAALAWPYYAGLLCARLLRLPVHRSSAARPAACFRAFLDNNWVGGAVFAGSRWRSAACAMRVAAARRTL